MGKPTWKRYYDIGNVIVRLSDGSDACKQNAILVNAHSDSTLPSPGAADDLIGVATMLEALRVMGMSERRLTNSVVFREWPTTRPRRFVGAMLTYVYVTVFNGGEESLQDASHRELHSPLTQIGVSASLTRSSRSLHHQASHQGHHSRRH